MSPTQTTVAHLLIDLPWWSWRPGMRAVSTARPPLRLVAPGVWAHEPPYRTERHRLPSCSGLLPGDAPDLDDPATVGCLLAMLVEIQPFAGWGLSCVPDVGWRCESSEYDIPGDSAGEAVALALLAIDGRGEP